MPLTLAEIPVEVQCLILRQCLQGWSATLGIYAPLESGPDEKYLPGRRIWSSHFSDKLALSVTCKSFLDIIQNIQRDPTLFNGEIDFLSSSGYLSYLIGEDESATYGRTVPKHSLTEHGIWIQAREIPTRVFIKNPINTVSKACIHQELPYDTMVMVWFRQNTQCLVVELDKVNMANPWSRLPNLRHLDLYWYYGYIDHELLRDLDLPICRLHHDDIIPLIKRCVEDYGSNECAVRYDLGTDLEPLLAKGWKITVTIHIHHVHLKKKIYQKLTRSACGTVQEPPLDGNRLKCIVEIEGDDWKIVHIECANVWPADYVQATYDSESDNEDVDNGESDEAYEDGTAEDGAEAPSDVETGAS